MAAASEYLLEPIRNRAEFTLYRGRQRGNPMPLLAVAPTTEPPPPQSLGRLEHERTLGAELEPQFLSWNFSTTPVGTTRATGRIYLTNKCPAPMNLSSTVVTLAGADPGDFSLTDDCSAAVAPYQSCELLFAFAPKVVGFRQAEIAITSPQIQNGLVIIPITGLGK